MGPPVGSDGVPTMPALTCAELSRGNEMRSSSPAAAMRKTFLTDIPFLLPPQFTRFHQNFNRNVVRILNRCISFGNGTALWVSGFPCSELDDTDARKCL